jgi:hypothetical protein
MASNKPQQRGLFAGLNPASADLARTALKYGDEWGGGLGRQVVDAALAGSDANLRSDPHTVGRPSKAGNSTFGDAAIKALAQAVYNYIDGLGTLNAAPATLLGLLGAGAGTLAHPKDVKWGIGDKSIEVTNMPWLLPGSALTVGNVQMYSPQLPPNVPHVSPYTGQVMTPKQHENFHVGQWKANGLPFFVDWPAAGGTSDSNPFEVQADNAGAATYKKAHGR